MALSAAIQWEVRPTNGSADNGGGFKAGATGTDYSQQNAAQASGTNLSVDVVTNTKVQSATYNFTGVDVGNIIAITAGVGWTTGLYEITAVGGNEATLDRSPAAAGVTGGTWAEGGARSGFSNGTNALQGLLVAGQKVWVKNEAWNEAVALSVSGTNAATMIVVEGYNSSRSDNPTPVNSANMPRNNRAAAGTIGISVTGTFNTIKYIWVSNAGTSGFATTVGSVKFYHCKSSNNGTIGFDGGTGTTLCIACESNNNTTIGFSTLAKVVGCYSHNNTTTGYTAGGNTGNALMYSIFAANASHGISNINVGVSCINCTIDANTGASTDGFNASTPSSALVLLNCQLTNNGRYGSNATTAAIKIDSVEADYNNYFGNGTAAYNNWFTGTNDKAVNPNYTGGTDYTPNNALVIGVGWPGVIDASSSTGYPDIGAVQKKGATPFVIGG